jgi:hypothetical protein
MEHVRPKIGAEVTQWDNMSADKEYNAHDHGDLADPVERQAWKSFNHCRDVCEAKKTCIQFTYDMGTCTISESFKLGYAKPREKVKSGWMLDRVDELFLQLESKCSVRDWFSPQEGSLFQKRK